MRHTTTAAAVLLLALTATACGHNTSDAKAGKASPTPTVSKADRYLKTAHAVTFNGSPTDEDLLTYPPQWCTGLDAGHSVQWLFAIGGGNLYPAGQDWGTVKKDADQLLVAGVRAYCPQNTAAVTDELRASGDY